MTTATKQGKQEAKPQDAATTQAAGPVFEDVPVPQVTRQGAPNPYTEPVRQLKGTDRARAFTLPGSTETGRKGNKALNTARRQLSAAGHAAGVTVRSKVEVTDGGVRVTFWTTDRITRGSK